MSVDDVILALRDEETYLSLGVEQLAQMPDHPAGSIKLRERVLAVSNELNAQTWTGCTQCATTLTMHTHVGACCC